MSECRFKVGDRVTLVMNYDPIHLLAGAQGTVTNIDKDRPRDAEGERIIRVLWDKHPEKPHGVYERRLARQVPITEQLQDHASYYTAITEGE